MILSYVLLVNLHEIARGWCSTSVVFIALLLFLLSECACLTDLTHLPRSFEPCSRLLQPAGRQ